MEHSARIYEIYLQFVAPEDIHVYSIDEVFIDATPYLRTYGLSAHDLAVKIIQEVLRQTGITATAGIGTNLYLCKVAMDIVAKHRQPDTDGVRIAELNERSYRELLWDHRPLTDFWRVGRGYARKLEKNGMFTMGDVARCSVGNPNEFYNENLLYKLFGVNAELLIDHAWGYESCTIADIKAYKPQSNSLGSGQVLHCAYTAEKARLVTREMTDLLVLDLVEKGLVTDQMVLTIGYDIENLSDPERCRKYSGPVVTDHYGRKIPKHAHGSVNLPRMNSSTTLITDAVMELFDRIVNPDLLVRRINIVAGRVVAESQVQQETAPVQLNLFYDAEAARRQEEAEQAALEREKRRQKAVITIKKKYGKNAIIKGMNLEEGATAMDRNRQIGGHKA
jgi:DNA polymerase V